MKTGAELIAEERNKQLEKYKYDSDYVGNELIIAALAAISGKHSDMPASWAESNFALTIHKKSTLKRLVIAGALIAAEIDRRLNEKQNKEDSFEALAKIAPAKKWIEMYKHYQELLTKADAAEFWHEQFNIADKERNELKLKNKS